MGTYARVILCGFLILYTVVLCSTHWEICNTSALFHAKTSPVSWHPNCRLTYTARLWSSSSAGWGSWACPPSPPLSRSPHRNMMGRWFSSGALRTECQSRDRRAERSCTPLARAPGSAAGLCGISGGYSCCQRLLLAWCRLPHILTAGSHISHTGHSPALPLDTGSGRPQRERKLEEENRDREIKVFDVQRFRCQTFNDESSTCHDGGHTWHLDVSHQI